MKLFTKSFLAIFRRPSIMLFLGIIIGVLFYFSDPIASFIGQLMNMGYAPGETLSLIEVFNNLVRILIYFLAVLNSPVNILIFIGGLLGFSIVIGGLLALGFSGYFNSVFYALDKKKSEKHSFLNGIKKYFFKIWKVNILFIIVSFITIILTTVSIVPSISLLSMKIESYHIWGIVFAIATGLVLLFVSIYYTIYISFWYPSIYTVDSKPFSYAKKIADMHFLGIFVRFLLLLVILFIGNMLLDLIPKINFIVEPVVICKVVFYTVFGSFAVTYVFALFRYLDRQVKKAIQ